MESLIQLERQCELLKPSLETVRILIDAEECDRKAASFGRECRSGGVLHQMGIICCCLFAIIGELLKDASAGEPIQSIPAFTGLLARSGGIPVVNGQWPDKKPAGGLDDAVKSMDRNGSVHSEPRRVPVFHSHRTLPGSHRSHCRSTTTFRSLVQCRMGHQSDWPAGLV